MLQNRIYYVYLKQDDPKKSTMKKLEHYGLAIKIRANMIGKKLVLTPYSDTYLLNSDSFIYTNYGICLIDGSWNLIDTIKNLRVKNARRLPLLLPVNPVNYGKPGKLSSLEALAASLYIMGYPDAAFEVLSKYSWAQNFIIINMEPLEEYKKCKNNEECRDAEKLFF
ncbi:ribosome biogenesis protein [Acidiplasma aeolicum]|uniref:16S rRNA aminocarboxypropyltransferase n=1 Tax=Acidiplasma aeolicum TaxID=507754 RepID=A0A0P9GZP4_9ARCH|nr:ribosome biogenesis protein [Acidiplasma sp. MBA-1]KPV47144.1 ribosome biogenesis protein [Acidiplasma aeolicum]